MGERGSKEIRRSYGFKNRDVKKLTGWNKPVAEMFRSLGVNSETDMADFEGFKAGEINWARRRLEADKNANLDELAECFKTQEVIEQIEKKLNTDEDFSEEEQKFLQKNTKGLEGFLMGGYYNLFPVEEYMTPNPYYDTHHGIIGIPNYRRVLDGTEGYPEWNVVARAQLRDLIKEDRALLHNNEEIQNTLENMEKRRADNPFFGETNVNSATGEARTFDLEDDYPQLEGESAEEYANRLKRIGLKTRLAEKRQ